MIKILLIAIPVLIVVFLVAAAMQPKEFRIARSVTIAAPAAVVFDQINDFHKWDKWSPWAKMDPDAKNSFEGPASGVGAAFAWDGNSQVGAGKMTVTESRPGELLRIQMEFIKPFAATHTVEFIFKPQGTDTVLTWSMAGENSFMAKAVTLIMNCDKMVGGQYEKGLAEIKSLSEAAAKK